MTCIAGLVHDGDVWLGGDALASTSSRHEALAGPKVFTLEANGARMLVGIAGSPREMQLLQYTLSLPEHRADRKEPLAYLCTDFVNALRACLKAGGIDHKDAGQESFHSHLLLGFRGVLYTVEGNFQVIQNASAYAAIGSGGDYALGSLHTTEAEDWEPRERVQIALEAAAHFNPFVGPPFTILRLPGEEKPS